MECDVCIVGAGPAGLMASIFAAGKGASVIVLERNTTAGRKLLRTGGGRCNVTHASTVRELIGAFDAFGRFLRHGLYEFSADDMIAFLADHGVSCRVENDGCVFPDTDRATDIKNVLLAAAKAEGVRLLYGKRVTGIKKDGNGFLLKTEDSSIDCQKVIIATGGKSWPDLGSTGDGYKLAKKFGHTVVEPKAAVVGLIAKEKWIKKLQGVALGDVRITCDIDGKKVAATGAMIFTDKGISGPAVFDLSRFVVDEFATGGEAIGLCIDLVPQLNHQQLQQYFIDSAANHPKKELLTILCELLPKSIVIQICRLGEMSAEIRIGQLAKSKRVDILKKLKALPITVKSTRPLEEATVTRGGVSLDEIDPKTMQSRITKGLFFAGEVINADGPCGGYNLQIAWSTGSLAGKSAAI